MFFIPQHGHSTGIHCYIPSNDLLVSALKLVLEDVDRKDLAEQRGLFKKRFITGASLGAFVILEYLLAYPPLRPDMPSISGAFLMCPLIEVSPSSRPSKTVELIARVIRTFAGRVPMASAQRGKGHDDREFISLAETVDSFFVPRLKRQSLNESARVELSFLLNPQAYHGSLRIATGLAIAEGLINLAPRASELSLPIKVIHGANDRVTSPQGSKEFFGRAQSKDLQVEIWPGYEVRVFSFLFCFVFFFWL